MNDLEDIEVRHAMTTDLIAASTLNRFSQVVAFFAESKHFYAPVLDPTGALVGLLTVRKVLSAFYSHTLKMGRAVNIEELDQMVKIENIMIKDPLSVSPDTKLEVAKKTMAKGGFNSLPVLDNGKLVGLITTQDLIKLKILKIDGSDYNPI